MSSRNVGGKLKRGRDEDDLDRVSPGAAVGTCKRSKKQPQQQTPSAEPINQPLALEYICPIFKSLPVDPVMAEDGRIYERAAIEEHIMRQGNNVKSPLTNEPMGSKVFDAVQVRNTIHHLIETQSISEDLIYSWKRNKDVWDANRRAEAGDVTAMNQLATWYSYGCRGLPKDISKSYEWYKRASDLGCTNAMAALCKCFLLKDDIGRDLYNPSLGVYYLTRGAESGNASACLMLGTAFMREEYGLPRDIRLAKMWLRTAMKHDAPSGVKIMARLLLEKLKARM